LFKAYEKHLQPLEKETLFNKICDPALTEADIQAPPILLLMGQYSTGKTSFIRALLGSEYPGSRIAAEPATDQFTTVMRGNSEEIRPGNTLVLDQKLPFHSLKFVFGEKFLRRFSGSFVAKPENGTTDILDDVIIIDTPGTLDGSGEDRDYDFPEVMGWFAQRATLILLFFDVNKMGVATEMKNVLKKIQGNEEKIKIICNKADTVNEIDLAGSLQGLRHNLAKSLPTPEVPQVYVSSLDTLKDEYRMDNTLWVQEFSQNKKKLMDDIERMRKNIYFAKVDNIDKRARMVRNHAYVMMKLKNERQKCLRWYRRSLQPKHYDKLVNSIPELYSAVQNEKNRSPQEFISSQQLQDKLKQDTLVFDKLPNLKEKTIEKKYKELEKAISKLNR